MYKIIFCDLDGTLLDSNRKLSSENKKAIEYALSKNVKIVLCSGRSNMSIDVLNERLELINEGNYTVAFNGGVVYENVSKKKFVNHKLKAEYGYSILDILEGYSCEILAYQNEKLWCDKITPRKQLYSKHSFIPLNYVDNLKNLANKDFSKIICIGKNDILTDIQNVCNTNKINNNASIVFSSDDLLEFNPKGINKGTGVIDLLNKLNIEPEAAIAVGDNYNDIPMVEVVGNGIAVQNAVPEIKAKASYITAKDNNNNAVAEAIYKFIK